MIDLISSGFIVAGALLIFLSAAGILRMPDLYLRMSATTKGATLGAGFILLGTALHFFDVGIFSRILVIIFLLAVTTPVAAHLIGRAAYFNGVPLWKRTAYDEMKNGDRESKPKNEKKID